MKIAILLVCATFLALISVTFANSHHAPSHAHHADKPLAHHGTGDAGIRQAGRRSHTKHHKKPSSKQVNFVEEHQKGVKEITSGKIEDKEEIGKKHKADSVDSHQSHKKASAHTVQDANSKSEAKQKATHVNKGFSEEHHKDEHKVHNSFYNNNHKTGEFKLYGNKNKKYHVRQDDKDEQGKFVHKKPTDKKHKKVKSDTHTKHEQKNVKKRQIHH